MSEAQLQAAHIVATIIVHNAIHFQKDAAGWQGIERFSTLINILFRSKLQL